MVLYADLKIQPKIEEATRADWLWHPTQARTFESYHYRNKLHNFPERMYDNNKYTSYSDNQA